MSAVYKQILVLNRALNMSAGKAAAQAAHAAIGAFERAEPKAVARWQEGGVTKIVLGIRDETELLLLKAKCLQRNLPHFLVADAGRTEIAEGSLTALGIGPADGDAIDTLTGNLPLY